jgi:hypothetical protein
MNKHNKLYHHNQIEECQAHSSIHEDTELAFDGHYGHEDAALNHDTYSSFVTSLGITTDGVMQYQFSTTDICTEPQRNQLTYGNDVSHVFFGHDKKSVAGGSTCLVTRAITETPIVVSQMIHPRDICYHMKVGKFLNHLTRGQVFINAKLALPNTINY